MYAFIYVYNIKRPHQLIRLIIIVRYQQLARYIYIYGAGALVVFLT